MEKLQIQLMQDESLKPPSDAKHTQAEINNRARVLYLEHYDLHTNEMGALDRQAARFYADCLKKALEEMGPPIEFNCGGEFVHPQIEPHVQALIDRMAKLKASPLERAKAIHFRGNAYPW